jgi:hypothetical protein
VEDLTSLLAQAEASRFPTFFFFATGFATGIVAVLTLLPVPELGRRFFVLMSFLAIVFVALAVASAGLEIGYWHLGLAALLILYNLMLPAQTGVDRSVRRETLEGGPRSATTLVAKGVLLAAAACGVVGIVRDALQYPALEFSSHQGAWLVASFLSSALLLGSALTAMVLGHWYLVARNLSFAPLARVALFFSAMLLLRMMVVVGDAVAQGTLWDSLISRAGPTGFFLSHGIFVAVRAVFGLLAPAAFAWMTWKCVQLRANQSATGILYVNLAFVLVGEIIAKYFLVSQGLVL